MPISRASGGFRCKLNFPAGNCDNAHNVRPFIKDFVFLLYERKGLECRFCCFLRSIVSHESNRRGLRECGGTGEPVAFHLAASSCLAVCRLNFAKRPPTAAVVYTYTLNLIRKASHKLAVSHNINTYPSHTLLA